MYVSAPWTFRHVDVTAQGYFGAGIFRPWGRFGTVDVSAHGRFGTVDVSAHGRFSSVDVSACGCFGTVDVSARGHFGTVDISAREFFGTGHFGTGFFSPFQIGNFLTWTFRHGGHFGTVDISARGFFGTGRFGTGFVSTFQFMDFLTWTFRHGGHFGTGIFWHWTFRHWTFRHWHRFFQHISVGEFWGISTFLTFKNFGTWDIIKGFAAKPPLLGRNSPLSLSHNPQSVKSHAEVVFFYQPCFTSLSS
jgi:hypothetical protein